MSWAAPWALAALAAPLAALALYAVAVRWKNRLRRDLGGPVVLDRLTDPLARRRQHLKALCAVLALAAFAAALAGPCWGRLFQEVRRRGSDVVIAVDVSASMLAEDLSPNRLTQAKRELGLLIDGLSGDRVGLVAFAGAAFLQCPLTLDHGAARSLLELLGPDLIPTPGTHLAEALRVSLDALGPGAGHRALVILTDGEDHSGRLEEAVKRAEAEGVRVFPVGFGSPDGEVLPIRGPDGAVTAYKKDRTGQTIVSKLDEKSLQDMAARTGGRYYRATQGEVEIDRLLEDLRALEKKDLETRRYGRQQNRYQFPLAAALLLLVLELLWPEQGRSWRKKNVSAALALLLLAAPPLAAQGRRPDSPEARFNHGNALYRAGDHAAAAAEYEKAFDQAQDLSLKARSAYNRGNALFRQNKLQEALEQYKNALRADPADLNAKRNLELTQRVLKAMPPQQGPGEGDKKDGKGDPQPSQQSGDDKGTKEKDAPAPRPKEGMTPEDARRLLEAATQREKEAMNNKKTDPSSRPGMEQDW